MLIKKKLKAKTFKPCAILTFSLYGVKNIKLKVENHKALASQLTLKKLDQKKRVGCITTKKKLLMYKEAPLFSWVLNNLKTMTTRWSKKAPLGIFTKRLKKNKNILQLHIILKSYNGSPKRTADIQLGLDTISKLIDYLNHFCTKGFKNITYPRKKKYKDYLDTSHLINTDFNKLFLDYSTASLKSNQGFFLQQEKSLLNSLVLNLQSKDQKLCLCAEVLQKSNYSNRYFFKWCELFATNSSINKQIHRPLHSTQLVTVVRSPFVFKKTREQFSSQKLSYRILVKLQNPMQKLFLIQSLGLLRLPCELEIVNC